MKIVLIAIVAAGLGYWGGSSLAIAKSQESVAQFIQSPEGIEGCRQIVRAAGG